MSIDRTVGAELAIAQLIQVGSRSFLFLSTCPALRRVREDRLRRSGAGRKVAHLELVALRQDLGDAAAVAHPPIGLVAQQAAGSRGGELRNLPQVELGLGRGELFLDDPPE